MATDTRRGAPPALGDADVRQCLERYIAGWNSRDADRLLALLADEFVWDDPAMRGEPARDPAAARRFLEMSWRASSDLAFEMPRPPARSIEDPNEVILSWRFWGTFDGPLDPPGFAPTGGRIDVTGLDEIRIADEGKIERIRAFYDLSALAMQVGAMPEPNTRMERAGVRMQRLTARLARRRAG